MHKKSVRSLVMILVVLIVYLFTNINVYAANPLSQVKKRTFGEYKVNSGVNHNQTSSNTGYSDKENDPPNANYDLYFNIKIHLILLIINKHHIKMNMVMVHTQHICLLMIVIVIIIIYIVMVQKRWN